MRKKKKGNGDREKKVNRKGGREIRARCESDNRVAVYQEQQVVCGGIGRGELCAGGGLVGHAVHRCWRDARVRDGLRVHRLCAHWHDGHPTWRWDSGSRREMDELKTGKVVNFGKLTWEWRGGWDHTMTKGRWNDDDPR